MCGIAGLWSPGVRAGELRPIVERMTSTLWRRGPDDDGFWCGDGVALGMRRLSIIDVAGGRQPIASEDGSIVAVCNGEIYNHLQLRRDLQSRGHRFATGSDVEVAIHLYEELCTGMLAHLRGMFGLAIWDARRAQLLVARDRLGIKPMFVLERPGLLAFASELKALQATPWASRDVDEAGLDRYLARGYVPAPYTIFKGVRKLLPGHYLQVSASGSVMNPYWQLPPGIPAPIDERDALEELERRLQEAVSSHLMSDVPLGAFLSGGVDSSLIVAMMTAGADRPVRTFTIGFGGQTAGFLDERPYARLTSQRYRTEHVEFEVKPDVEAVLDEVVEAFDEPFADDSVIPSYYICQLARQHVTVALTGLGGDELFGGYERHLGIALSDRLERLAPRQARQLAAALLERLPDSSGGSHRVDHLKRFARAWALDGHARYRSYLTVFDPAARAALLTTPSPPTEVALPPIDDEPLLAWALRHDLLEYLPDDVLALTDRLSMWHSLELRVPFLDHPLVEFCQRVPVGFKVRGGSKKHLLKRLAGRWLPEEVLRHRKQGFEAPMATWLRRDLRDYVNSVLSPGRLSRYGLLRPDAVTELLAAHQEGRQRSSKQIFAILMLQKWLERRNRA